jgi:GDP-4-dehydro-6-deoxy-D-mannose reductase
MKVLVVGINGFVGKHLARELYLRGHGVVGVGLDRSISEDVSSYVTEYIGDCNLLDVKSVGKIPLKNVDVVINLAGLSSVGASFANESLYIKMNVKVHTHLISRIKKTSPHIRIIAISSGAVYDSNQPMPLFETSKLSPMGSPYAASKIILEKELQDYIKLGMDITIVRPFNHIGPGQKKGFIVPDLAEKITKSNSITIGPINTSRDYTDVRDVVRAYALLAENPVSTKNRVFNICSGKAVSRDKLIEKIANVLRKNNIKTTVDMSLTRPNDAKIIYGSSDLFFQYFGWEPRIPLDKTIDDYMQWLLAT